MKDGTFLVVKRFAQVDLSGNELRNHPPDNKIEAAKDSDSGALGGVIRKRSVASAALTPLGTAVTEEAPSQQADRHKSPDQQQPNNGIKRQDNEVLPETPGHLM